MRYEAKDRDFEALLQNMPEGQRKIFLASVDEFAERGFAASSTLAIAERAGVSEALIFKYFKNKATLLKQVVFPIVAEAIVPLAIRGLREVTGGTHDTIESFLEALVRERLQFARRHKKHLRILLQELPLNPELRTRMSAVLAEKAFPLLKERLVRFQREGLLCSLPADQLMGFMIPQILGFVLSRAVFEIHQPQDEEQDITNLVQVILYGLHGSGAKGSQVPVIIKKKTARKKRK
jgi:AcrR family transcriptional regulator